MKKKRQNGQVAVVISRGYGAGWSTWADPYIANALMFHPKLVELVESGKHKGMSQKDIKKFLKDEIGVVTQFYLGGWNGLAVEWVPIGTAFKIEEYDGAEQVVTKEQFPYVA